MRMVAPALTPTVLIHGLPLYMLPNKKRFWNHRDGWDGGLAGGLGQGKIIWICLWVCGMEEGFVGRFEPQVRDVVLDLCLSVHTPHAAFVRALNPDGAGDEDEHVPLD